MYKHEINYFLPFKSEHVESESSLSLSVNQDLPPQKLAPCELHYFFCVHSGL